MRSPRLGTIPRLEGRSREGGAAPGRGRELAPVPVALGALRFDRSADGALVVPEVTVIAPAGSEPSVVAVGSSDRVRQLLRALPGHLAATPTGPATAPPDEFRLASARPHRDFMDRVRAALAEIAAGSLDKLVLAREVTVRANRPFRQADLLGRLRALHPSCTGFALDGFIGATPELLDLPPRCADRLGSPRGDRSPQRGPGH